MNHQTVCSLRPCAKDTLPRGMPNRASPFRFVLTLLLASAVPFCCCDFRSLLSGCISCEPATPWNTRSVVADSDSGAGPDGAADSHCHGQAPKGGERSRSTPGEAPEERQHDCSCDKNSGRMLTVEKSTLELPLPAIDALLAWSGVSDPRPLDPFRGHGVEQRVLVRPQSTLLRMHCALIV